jgi:DNA-binding MarR family transcriptional regulator
MSYNETTARSVYNRERTAMPLSGQSRQVDVPSEHLEVAAALYQAISVFLQDRQTMPAQYITSFLLVAMHQGKSVNEYAEMAQVSTSVMSRHLLDIGDRNRHMTEGFGLVTSRPNPMELRKHEVFLTPKGRAMLNTINRVCRMVMGRSHKQQEA